jgi:hypothetical protein
MEGLVSKFIAFNAVKQSYTSLIGVALSVIPFLPLIFMIKNSVGSLNVGLLIYIIHYWKQ